MEALRAALRLCFLSGGAFIIHVFILITHLLIHRDHLFFSIPSHYGDYDYHQHHHHHHPFLFFAKSLSEMALLAVDPSHGGAES